MKIEEIDKWLDNEYGVSYTRLEELHDFVVERDMKHQEEAEKEIERLTSNWNELKQFINTNCFYDGDTITYEELCDKIMYLENKGSDKK